MFVFGIAVLAVYRISYFIALDDGPFDVGSKFRGWIGQKSWIGRGFHCVVLECHHPPGAGVPLSGAAPSSCSARALRGLPFFRGTNLNRPARARCQSSSVSCLPTMRRGHPVVFSCRYNPRASKVALVQPRRSVWHSKIRSRVRVITFSAPLLSLG